MNLKRSGIAFSGAALAALAFTACGPATDRGEVIAKNHADAYTYYQNQCYSYNSQGMCTMSVPTPVTVPEKWEVRVQDDNGTEAWLRVSSSEYETIDLGEYYQAAEN